jgi:hypothetical protein
MEKLRCATLYSKASPVSEGDEFYELTLVKDFETESVRYIVKTFHGLAGSLPPQPEEPKPECQKTFPTLEESTKFFEKLMGLLDERGFVLYNPCVHGDRDFRPRPFKT